ncbi:HD domain-containing protein [Streptomyces halstedii]|uniref:HD domain-containing protein n=1 Tax=Streptomyces halstedii TaxID=1944 RepID=UPI003354F5D6
MTIPVATGSFSLPPRRRDAARDVVAEYEARESPEAVCARDADKLECMLQGIEYKAQGYENAQRWIDNSRARLVTETGRRLADELLGQGPLDWLRTALGETKP